jgi:hypothetical protein
MRPCSRKETGKDSSIVLRLCLSLFLPAHLSPLALFPMFDPAMPQSLMLAEGPSTFSSATHRSAITANLVEVLQISNLSALPSHPADFQPFRAIAGWTRTRARSDLAPPPDFSVAPHLGTAKINFGADEPPPRARLFWSQLLRVGANRGITIRHGGCFPPSRTGGRNGGREAEVKRTDARRDGGMGFF